MILQFLSLNEIIGLQQHQERFFAGCIPDRGKRDSPGGSDVLKALPATPQDFDARFSITFTTEEPAQLGNPADGLTQGGFGVTYHHALRPSVSYRVGRQALHPFVAFFLSKGPFMPCASLPPLRLVGNATW
jgi:hypothetical protein